MYEETKEQNVNRVIEELRDVMLKQPERTAVAERLLEELRELVYEL